MLSADKCNDCDVNCNGNGCKQITRDNDMQLIKGRTYERFDKNGKNILFNNNVTAKYVGQMEDGLLLFDVGDKHDLFMADPTLIYKEVVDISETGKFISQMDDSLRHIVPPFHTGEPLMIPEVYCILGVACSGKSTYIDQEMKKMKEKMGVRPVIVKIGKFLRECLGEEFFLNCTPPIGCPVETDNWVKSTMTDAFAVARRKRLPVILDGFPRSVAQLDWLMLSSTVSKNNERVKLIVLVNEEQVILDRIESRSAKTGNFDRMLSLRRLQQDASMLADIQVAAGKLAKSHPITVEVVEF